MNIKSLFTFWALWPSITLSAQGLTYSTEEQKAWNDHRNEMTEPVEFLAADALSAIQSDYIVNPYDVKKLRSLCSRMETHMYLHNYILEAASERHSIKQEIETLYWDSIAGILIPFNPTMAGTYTGYAVKMAEELKLSEDTLFTLNSLSIGYARRLRTDPCAYFAKEEMDTLKSIIDRQRLEKVIIAINAKEVENRCEQLWQRLESAGLTIELDKAIDLRQASNFYQKEMLIRDYFIDSRELTEANLADLYRHKPRCIKMDEGLRQREAVKKRHEEKVGDEFAW